jgi:hypothetical protein
MRCNRNKKVQILESIPVEIKKNIPTNILVRCLWCGWGVGGEFHLEHKTIAAYIDPDTWQSGWLGFGLYEQLYLKTLTGLLNYFSSYPDTFWLMKRATLPQSQQRVCLRLSYLPYFSNKQESPIVTKHWCHKTFSFRACDIFSNVFDAFLPIRSIIRVRIATGCCAGPVISGLLLVFDR